MKSDSATTHAFCFIPLFATCGLPIAPLDDPLVRLADSPSEARANAAHSSKVETLAALVARYQTAAHVQRAIGQGEPMLGENCWSPA